MHLSEVSILLHSLPTYYQLLLYILVGFWSFGISVHILEASGVHVAQLFGQRSTLWSSSPTSPLLMQHINAVHTSIYTASIALTIVLFTSISLFFYFNSKIVPCITYLLLLVVTFAPSTLFLSYRKPLLLSLKRSFSLSLDGKVTFLDVIVCDIFTSYARVFSDLVFILCDLLGKNSCYSSFLGPAITMFPFLVRFRQCLAEYRRDRQLRHLANAAKYITALPVIISGGMVGYLHSSFPNSPKINAAFGFWVFSSFINSGVSLYWDIVMDWSLGAISNRYTQVKDHPSYHRKQYIYPLLRSVLLYGPAVYYIAILLDTFLRFTWILKISASLSLIDFVILRDIDADGKKEQIVLLDAILKILEILRRFGWCVFRVEREWVCSGFVDEQNLRDRDDGRSGDIGEGAEQTEFRAVIPQREED